MDDETMEDILDELMRTIFPPDGVWYEDDLRTRMKKILQGYF
jgi:hypothetical protein